MQHSSNRPMLVQILGWLLALYLLASVFTHPALIVTYGNYLPEARRIGAILILREVCFILMTLICFLMIMADGSVQRSTKWGCLLLLGYGLFLAVRTVILGDDWLLLAGLRSLLSIFAAGVIPFILIKEPKLIDRMVVVLKWIILIQLALCIFQAATLPTYFGRTFLGPRTFGTMPQPIHLSIVAGSAVVVFACQRTSLVWVLAGLMVALLTGGRAGMILAMVGLSVIAMRYISLAGYRRYLAIILAPLLLFGGQFIVSHPLISGRSGTVGGVLSDARWTVWGRALDTYSNSDLATILLGQGLGTGSNSLAVQTGLYTDATPVFIILSFGLLGFLLIFTALAMIWSGRASQPGIIALILVGLTQLIFELHPVPIILASAKVAAARWVHHKKVRKAPGIMCDL